MTDDLDLSRPLELAVLKTGRGNARCRLLGSDEQLTLRSSDVYDLVPGEIVTVRGRKQWRHSGYLYLSGELMEHRLDAEALGLAPLELREEGLWDPARDLGFGDEEPLADWQRAVVERGPRVLCCFEDSAPRADVDEDPILESIERREAGDFHGAHDVLMQLLVDDLRCLDAHAHLGNLAFDRPTGALRHYQVGARIAELSLPEGFDGFLPWGRIRNRPYLRCRHGEALCLWRLDRPDEALEVFESLLWLDPTDSLGARYNRAAITDGLTWSEANAVDEGAPF